VPTPTPFIERRLIAAAGNVVSCAVLALAANC
jgi:hypothetical protein